MRWLVACFSVIPMIALAQGGASPPVKIDADGTVHVPAHSVPMSSFLSTEGKAYVTEHLLNMQKPELLVQDSGIPPLLKGYLARQHELFAVERKDITLGGVHAYEYLPKDGIAASNAKRVLINLHGGGFSGCWPACAELESIPVASMGRIRVVSLDYRQGPKHRFPAASEDVAAAYRELLKTYKPQDIGIYGCSAGGMLTGMAVAWFQQHSLPRPGRRWPAVCRNDVGSERLRRGCGLYHRRDRRRAARLRRHSRVMRRQPLRWVISPAFRAPIRSPRPQAPPLCSRNFRRRSSSPARVHSSSAPQFTRMRCS